MNLAIDKTLTAALIAIILGAVAGVLTAVFPSDANPWIVPIVTAVTAIAALIRRQFNVPEGE